RPGRHAGGQCVPARARLAGSARASGHRARGVAHPSTDRNERWLFLDALGRETGRRLTPEDVTSIQQAHATAFRPQVPTVRPLPGAVELLAYLSRSRVHWAIATSGRLESARPLREMLGVAPDVPV